MKRTFTTLAIIVCALFVHAQSWTNLNVPLNSNNLGAINPNNSDIYVVHTNTGYYKSTNGGATWADDTTGFPKGTAVNFTCSNAGTLLIGMMDFTNTYGSTFPLLRRTSGSSSWTAVSSAPVSGNGTYYHAPNNTIYFVPAYDGIKTTYKSSDDGLTWSNTGSVCKSMAFDSDNHVYAIRFYNSEVVLSKSSDNAATWTELAASGMPGYPEKVVSTSGGTLYVAVDNTVAIVKSTDGGSSFASLDSMYASLWADANGNLFISKSGRVCRSDDGGTSWTNITDGIPAAAYGISAIYPHPDGTVYASNSYNVLKYGRASSSDNVKELSQAKTLSVYPNPGKGSFFVDIKNEKYSHMVIRDIQGRQVLNISLLAFSGQKEITNIPAGVFIVEAWNGNTLAARSRIVVE